MAKKRATKRMPSDIPEIEVTNFGPISKGKFAIKPLTIFVGPNNSGKTYAALLAHSLLSSYGNPVSMGQYKTWLTPLLTEKPFHTLIPSLEKLATSATALKHIPPQYSARAHDLLFGTLFAKRFFNIVENNFNTTLPNLIRIGSDHSEIKFSHSVMVKISTQKTGSSAKTTYVPRTQYTIMNSNGEILIDEKNTNSDVEYNKYFDPSTKSSFDVLPSVAPPRYLGLHTLLSLLHRISYSSPTIRFNSIYLPAARSGLITYYDTIVSNMMSNAKYGWPNPLDTGQLPATLYDFMRFLTDVKRSQSLSSHTVAKTMMEDMFDGELVVSRLKVDLPRLMYRFKNTDIPLNRSSSAITEITPLQLLQNYPKLYGVVIIEEPEAHLHPYNQTKLAKHLVRMINNGVCVLLTTHGVFFLEQLSMFLKMSKLTPDQRKALGYDENDYLDYDQVAPYSFQEKSRGVYEIKKIAHSADDGIPQDEFNKVTELMCDEEFNIDNPDEI